MANRLRQLDEAIRVARRWLGEAGAELREARLMAGPRRIDVARPLGWSQKKVLRIEHGRLLSVSHVDLAEFAAAVGLRLSSRLYPRGAPVRDQAQLKLIERLHTRISNKWRWQLEWVLPSPDELRAIDLLLSFEDCQIAVEAITRLRDVQAQVRAVQRKALDAHATYLILLIADTHGNRRAVAEHRAVLAEAFPLATRATLRALADGRDIGGNGLVLL